MNSTEWVAWSAAFASVVAGVMQLRSWLRDRRKDIEKQPLVAVANSERAVAVLGVALDRAEREVEAKDRRLAQAERKIIELEESNRLKDEKIAQLSARCQRIENELREVHEELSSLRST